MPRLIPDLANACPLASALDIVGERWSFLILRGAFHGLRHFEEFQSTLGIARNILSNRLMKLVEHGVLSRHPHPEDRRKISYELTDKGHSLLPVLVSLWQWGEQWETDCLSNLVLVDRRDGKPVQAISMRAHDGREVGVRELKWVEREALLPKAA